MARIENSGWQRITTLEGTKSFDLRGCDFHPGGEMLATTWFGTTTLRAIPSGETICEIKVKSGLFSTYRVVVCFSTSGNLLAMGCPDKTVRLWTVPDGKLLAELVGHKSLVRGLTVVSSGKYLLSFSEREICAWDLQTARLLRSLRTKGIITAWAVGGKGNLLAVGDKTAWDCHLNLYTVPSLEQTKTIKEPFGMVMDVAVHPEGNLIAFGDIRGAKIWDIRSDRLVGGHDHRGETRQVSLISDGTMLASWSRLRGWKCPAVHIMDVSSGRTLGTFDWPEARAATGLAECAGKLIVAKDDGTRFSLSMPSFQCCGKILHPSFSPQTAVSDPWCITTGDSETRGQTTVFWRP